MTTKQTAEPAWNECPRCHQRVALGIGQGIGQSAILYCGACGFAKRQE